MNGNVNGLLWNILLALVWVAITGTFTLTNFVIGFGIGFVILFLVSRVVGVPNYFVEFRDVLALAAFLLWELVLANLRVARDVISPRFSMKPGIVAVPLDAKSDVEITLLANMITLTPGSMTLDVSTDRRVIYLHAMYLDDIEEFKRDVKRGFEGRLLDALRFRELPTDVPR